MMMVEQQIDVHLRPAGVLDLAAINAVVEAAVLGWDLPDRVKRLSLPSYRYSEHDLGHLTLAVAETAGDTIGRVIAGVAAWERAAPGAGPEGARAMLLHGVYVRPTRQRQGIGRHLFEVCVDAARTDGYDGVLVKAHAEARGFFKEMGLQALPVQDCDRDYLYRYWQPLRW